MLSLDVFVDFSLINLVTGIPIVINLPMSLLLIMLYVPIGVASDSLHCYLEFSIEILLPLGKYLYEDFSISTFAQLVAINETTDAKYGRTKCNIISRISDFILGGESGALDAFRSKSFAAQHIILIFCCDILRLCTYSPFSSVMCFSICTTIFLWSPFYSQYMIYLCE